MPKTPLPTILLFTTGQGHYSLSQAIKADLTSKYKVIEVKTPLIMDRGYVLIYRWLPFFFRIPYLLTKWKVIRELGITSYKTQVGALIEASLKEYQPVVCISTYFMSSQVLKRLKNRYHFKLINIVANPRTVHPVEIIDDALNCVFDHKGLEAAKALSPRAKVEVTGWFVRPEFVPVLDKTPVRRTLGLDPGLPTLTLVTGSEGNHQALAILPQLLKITQPFQIVVICGHSSIFFNQVTQMAQHIPDHIKLVPLGFIQSMAAYFQASDLVLGKAGPNSIFEAVATQTPFLALSHIAGQETGNLEIITEYGLGAVEEETHLAAKLIARTVQTPETLQKFQPGLKKVAESNRQAGGKLLTIVEAYVSDSSPSS